MDQKIRLSGGVFFALLLRSKIEGSRNANRKIKSSEGFADQDVLLGLTKIVFPSKKMFPGEVETAKDNSKRFKNCTGRAPFFMLNDEAYIKKFNSDMNDNYDVLLGRTYNFTTEFIDTTELGKAELLIKALLEIIVLDDEISEDQPFFVLETGNSITKKQLLSLKSVCLDAFILGLWHYVICVVKDNLVGKYTYNSWWKSNGGNRRIYTKMLGENSTRKIELYRASNKKVCDSDCNLEYQFADSEIVEPPVDFISPDEQQEYKGRKVHVNYAKNVIVADQIGTINL